MPRIVFELSEERASVGKPKSAVDRRRHAVLEELRRKDRRAVGDAKKYEHFQQ